MGVVRELGMRKRAAACAIGLLPLLAAACAETKPPDIQSILLYPSATIQVDRTDRCDVVTNTASNTLVYLPAPADAWNAFSKANYPVVHISGCGRK